MFGRLSLSGSDESFKVLFVDATLMNALSFRLRSPIVLCNSGSSAPPLLWRYGLRSRVFAGVRARRPRFKRWTPVQRLLMMIGRRRWGLIIPCHVEKTSYVCSHWPICCDSPSELLRSSWGRGPHTTAVNLRSFSPLLSLLVKFTQFRYFAAVILWPNADSMDGKIYFISIR